MQSLKELFEKTEFKIPHPSSHPDFRQFLIDKIQKVENELIEIQLSKVSTLPIDVLDVCIKIYSHNMTEITKSLNFYYNGKIDVSYNIFSDLINTIQKDGFIKIPKSTIPLNENLYRLRSNLNQASISSLTRKDIFHIPNSLRRKVSNQRYSIAGYPCLYLTNSIYSAWEELGKPPLENCVFSKFKIDPKGISSNFLDLSCQKYYELKDPKSELEMIKKILFFPIIFSSSIKLENRDDGFYPEYIFSQFLTRWCKERSDIRGIIYTSSRVHEKSQGSFLNYAIPIMDEYSNSDPISEICSSTRDLLSCSEPISIASIGNNTTKGNKNLNVDKVYLDTLHKQISYEQTVFSKIELNGCS